MNIYLSKLQFVSLEHQNMEYNFINNLNIMADEGVKYVISCD